MLISFWLLCFLTAVTAVEPLVSLKYARYRGVPLPNGITQWLGIRYAAAPLGPLRFAAPQDPPLFDDIQPADKVRFPPDCCCISTLLTYFSMGLFVLRQETTQRIRLRQRIASFWTYSRRQMPMLIQNYLSTSSSKEAASTLSQTPTTMAAD